MNIRLKPTVEDDLELIMNWRMNPEVTKFMFTDPILTLEKQKKWFREIQNSKNHYIWTVFCEQKPVGIYSIKIINCVCYVGHYIGEIEYWHKGISSCIEFKMNDYIFKKFNISKIIYETVSCNVRAINLHKRLGCEIENIKRNSLIKNNKIYDVVVLSFTKTKWVNLNLGKYKSLLEKHNVQIS